MDYISQQAMGNKFTDAIELPTFLDDDLLFVQ